MELVVTSPLVKAIRGALHIFFFLLDKNNKRMSEILGELPTTYQSPTMAPYCKDSEKYEVVKNLVKEIINI